MVKVMQVNTFNLSSSIDKVGINNVISIIPEYTVNFGLMYWLIYKI